MPERDEEHRETAPLPEAEEETRTAVFAFPVAVRAAGGGASRDELMSLARKAAQDPAIFEEEGREPYFWAAEISTSLRDSYLTRMSNSTLKNFAEEATAGVAFMNSHRTGGWFSSGELPLGRSIRGTFIGGGGNGVARTQADFYTIPGLQLGEVSTDQAIAAIRSGIGSDVSVGFHLGEDGQYTCDLCGNDYLSQDCPHYIGMTYETEAGRAKKKTGQKCTATIERAHLSEVSLVYDGATPGAHILKANRAMEAGTLTPETARMLEQAYRIRLPAAQHFYALGSDGSVSIGGAGTPWLPVSDREPERFILPSSVPPPLAGPLWYLNETSLFCRDADGTTTEWQPVAGKNAAQTVTGSSTQTFTLSPPVAGTPAPEGDATHDIRAATDERKEDTMPENTAAGGSAAIPESTAALDAIRGELTAEKERAAGLETARAALEAEITALKAELGETPVAQLRQQAADGLKYRGDLLEALGCEAVRAKVTTNPALFQEQFRTAGLETIQEATAGFRAVGDAGLPDGRVTRDVDPAVLDEARNGAAAPVVPNRAFAG